MQSRNFRLQRVGNLSWLQRNYKFQEISFSIDELIVLNASRDIFDFSEFSSTVSQLVTNVFIPVAAGGKISSMDEVEVLFQSGADKVVFNSPIFKNSELVKRVIERYGSQSVIACLDYKRVDNDIVVYINNGEDKLDLSFDECLDFIEEIGVGEIYLNSIENDGTGFGYDLDTVQYVDSKIETPLIIAGGAGNENHFYEGLLIKGTSAVATANLFNFIGSGLPKARNFLKEKNVNIATYE